MNNSKTASQSKETIQAIDGITDVLNTALGIDGIVTTSVNLLKDSLAGEKTSLYSIINTNLVEITKATVSIANIVASIASVMTGESVNPNTKSVITKVSKKSIYGETPLTEFLEKSAKQYNEGSKKKSANATLELIVQGIDKDGMEGFIKVVEALSKEYKTDTKLLTSLNKGMIILTSISDRIDKLNLDNFDKKTVNKAIAFSDTMSSLFSVTELKPGKLDIKQLKRNIDGLTDIANKLITDGTLTTFNTKHSKSIINFVGAITLLASLSENDNIDDLKDTLKSLNKSLDTLNMISNSISSIDLTVFNEDLVENISSFRDMVVVLSTLTYLNTKKLQPAVKQILDSMPDLIEITVEAGTLTANIKKSFKGKGLESLVKFFVDLELVLNSAVKAGMISKAAAKAMPSIKRALEIVKDIVQIVIDADIPNINKSKVNNITNAKDIMTGISSIMIASSICALLCIPGMIGLFIIKITAKLLVKILNSIIKDFSKLESDDINAQFKSIGILLVTIGLVMLVACLTGGFIGKNIGNIFMFGLGLMIMLTMVLWPLRLFESGQYGDDPIGTAKAVAILIATCTIVMMIGALFMLTGLAEQALLFGVTLMTFITLVMLPIALISLFMNDISATLEVAVKMIITCTVIMVLGALFMLTGLWKESLMFGVVLMTFITMVLLPIVIASLFMKDIEGTLAKLTAFVVVCTLILMVGAWFMTTGLWLEAILFGAILMLFVGMVLAPFVLFGKKLQKQIPSLLMFGAFVAICAGILMIGAWFIKKQDPGGKNTLIFASILVGFVGLMSLCIKLLSKIPKKDLLTGTTAMGIISGITVIAAFAMKILADASKIADMKNLLGIVGIMISIIVSIGGLSVALGALATMPFTAPFFWAGLGAMAAVAGIALVFSKAIKNVAEAIAVLATVDQNGGIDEGRIMGLIGTIPNIGKAVGSAGKSLPTKAILRASDVCLTMAKVIAKIGNAVADISNLTVATDWDSNGNPIKYKQLDESDFTNAANNTEKIISTLGGAIISTYTKKPEMFTAPEFNESMYSRGELSKSSVKQGKTPFELVVRSCSTLGVMIRSIAQGVADLADMKIAVDWNSNGKPIAYRHLRSNDFIQAGKNIEDIITTLGEAVLTVYKDKAHLFTAPVISGKTSFFGLKSSVKQGKTPFELVVRSCSSLGSMITMIAQGVREFATMQIAIDWDSKGNPIKYEKLTDTQIQQAITNVGTIITTLFDAIGEVYNNPNLAGVFNSDYKIVNGHLVSSVPIYKVIGAGMLAGKMVSILAQGVFDVANLRIADDWNKDGVAIHYTQMTDPDFAKYEANVKTIISSTFKAIYEVYNEHEDYFKTSFIGNVLRWDNDSPIQKVIQASQGVGGLISELAKGTSEIMNLHIKDENGKPIPIKLEDLGVGGKLYKAVDGIVTGVMQALINAHDNTRDGAAKAMTWTKEELAEKVIPAMGNIKSLVIKSSELLGELEKNPINSDILKSSIESAVIPIMNILIGLHDHESIDPSKASSKIKWASSIIGYDLPKAIENVKKLQDEILKNTISATDSNLSTNVVELLNSATDIVNSIASVYDNTASGVTEKMQWTKNILVNEVIPSIENVKAVQQSLNNFTIGDNTAKLNNFETLVLGIFTPLTEVKPKEIQKFSKTFSTKNVNNITTLVKTVNTLNTNKADKFIQMIAELRQLSLSIKDMPKFIALLDQKLTESLSVLSDRVESASTVLQDSDKMQQERQSKIEDNAKLLKEMLQTPIKLELFKEDTGNGEASEDFGFDGDMETGGSVDTGGYGDVGGSSNLTGLVQKIARKLGAI